MSDTIRKQRTPRGNIAFAFALGLIAWVAWMAREAVLMLYVAALFATVLMPVVRSIERLRIRRWRPGKGSVGLVHAAGGGSFVCRLRFPRHSARLRTISNNSAFNQQTFRR